MIYNHAKSHKCINKYLRSSCLQSSLAPAIADMVNLFTKWYCKHMQHIELSSPSIHTWTEHVCTHQRLMCTSIHIQHAYNMEWILKETLVNLHPNGANKQTACICHTEKDVNTKIYMHFPESHAYLQMENHVTWEIWLHVQQTHII